MRNKKIIVLLKWQLETNFKDTFVSQQRLGSTFPCLQSFLLIVPQEKAWAV